MSKFDLSKVDFDSLETLTNSSSSQHVMVDYDPYSVFEVGFGVFTSVIVIILIPFLIKKYQVKQRIQKRRKCLSAWLSGWGIWCFIIFVWDHLFEAGISYTLWFTLPPLCLLLVVSWYRHFFINEEPQITTKRSKGHEQHKIGLSKQEPKLQHKRNNNLHLRVLVKSNLSVFLLVALAFFLDVTGAINTIIPNTTAGLPSLLALTYFLGISVFIRFILLRNPAHIAVTLLFVTVLYFGWFILMAAVIDNTPYRPSIFLWLCVFASFKIFRFQIEATAEIGKPKTTDGK